MPREVEYVDEDQDKPILRSLPVGTRTSIGQELARLQRGDRGEDLQQWRPLYEFGRGVGELKRGPWRVVLSTVVDPVRIWIVCVFRKDAKVGGTMMKKHEKLIKARLAQLASKLAPSTTRRH